MHKEQPFMLAAPDRRRREEMYDLIAKVFSHRGYFVFRDDCRKSYIGNSMYDWQTSRVGLVDGRLATHWGVWDYSMRIGSARVRVGGIGVVATHGDYRKMGLMARTAEASLAAMTEAGYDMTVLFGIWNFYHRFGYVRAWPESKHVVAAAHLPAGGEAVPVRPFAPRHRDDLAALYNRQYAMLTGTAVRPTYLLNRYPQRWRGYLWTAGGDRPQGYVIVSREGNNLGVVEACGEPAQVLRVVARLAQRGFCQDVIFDSLPYEHPLARELRQGTCRVETHYTRNGGAMIRTVNLASTLGKMCGELSNRLRASQLAQWRGCLSIADTRQRVMLQVERGKVSIAPAAKRAGHCVDGGDRIAQLLIGTDRPGEIARAGDMKLTGQAPELIEVLFPQQHPILSSWDRF